MNLLNTLDSLQNKIIEDKPFKNNKPEYHFDKLNMFFGQPYIVNKITIIQPSIGDILNFGEDNFYKALSPFLYNSTSIRLFLWENKIDWNKVSDIEVFSYLMPAIAIPYKNILDLIFDGINFSDFKLLQKKTEDDSKKEFLLYSKSQDILLTENEYMEIAEYLRELLNIHPKVEKAKGKSTKQWMIQEEKMKLKENKNNDSSNLLSLISTCTNYSGFKYKLEELRDVSIYQFMDAVKRIQKYENSVAALRGCYSGFVDSSKLPSESLNFMGDI